MPLAKQKKPNKHKVSPVFARKNSKVRVEGLCFHIVDEFYRILRSVQGMGDRVRRNTWAIVWKTGSCF